MSAPATPSDVDVAVAPPEQEFGGGATLTDIGEPLDPGVPFEAPIGKWLFDVIKSLDPNLLGIGQIYWLLERFVEANDMTDVSVVLNHSLLGTQIFRLGAKPIDANLATKYWNDPGIYCEPDCAPAEESAIVLQLCQFALVQHVFRFNAAHDPLTNVANRRSFDEALKTASANSARHGWAFALVLLDLNGFKSVNDTHGHDEGDRLLKQVGFALRQSVREGDVAARTGGDEFALILNNAETAEAELIVARVKSQLRALGTFIDFACGKALSPKQSTDPEELYRIADEELRRNKGGAR